jgi:Tol biopolymer transport system component
MRWSQTFAESPDGSREIYVINADGSNQTRLTNNLGQDYGLSWLPVEMGSLSTT